jgi:hypothetical protein
VADQPVGGAEVDQQPLGCRRMRQSADVHLVAAFSRPCTCVRSHEQEPVNVIRRRGASPTRPLLHVLAVARACELGIRVWGAKIRVLPANQ